MIILNNQIKLIISSLLFVSGIAIYMFSNMYPVLAIEYSNYTSEKYQIKFQYPSDWTVTEKMSRFDEGVDIQIKSLTTSGLFTIGLVKANLISEGLNWDTINKFSLEQATNSFENEYTTIEEPSVIKINNHDAGTYVYSWKEKYNDDALLWGVQHWSVFIGDHGYVLTFMTLGKNFDSPENTEIRNKFIDSIQFLGNSTVTSSTEETSRFS